MSVALRGSNSPASRPTTSVSFSAALAKIFAYRNMFENSRLAAELLFNSLLGRLNTLQFPEEFAFDTKRCHPDLNQRPLTDYDIGSIKELLFFNSFTTKYSLAVESSLLAHDLAWAQKFRLLLQLVSIAVFQSSTRNLAATLKRGYNLALFLRISMIAHDDALSFRHDQINLNQYQFLSSDYDAILKSLAFLLRGNT